MYVGDDGVMLESGAVLALMWILMMMEVVSENGGNVYARTRTERKN